LQEFNHAFHVPLWVLLRHLVHPYGVQPVRYKMPTVTDYMDWCRVVPGDCRERRNIKWYPPDIT
jgi:hypothetical protein